MRRRSVLSLVRTLGFAGEWGRMKHTHELRYPFATAFLLVMGAAGAIGVLNLCTELGALFAAKESAAKQPPRVVYYPPDPAFPALYLPRWTGKI